METKICTVCGDEFEPNQITKIYEDKFCTSQCQSKDVEIDRMKRSYHLLIKDSRNFNRYSWKQMEYFAYEAQELLEKILEYDPEFEENMYKEVE